MASNLFRALRHRNFRIFFIGQALSNIGTWLQQVAMGWLTYRVTGSAWILGVVAFCTNFGILVLSPFAGVLADRVNRHRALMATQVLMLAQAAVLTIIVALGHVQVWHLIVLALWLGVAWAFNVPLRQTMYVYLVTDRADLANAIALNSFTVNAARVVGPAVAGVLIATLGEAWCFGINAFSFLLVIGTVAQLEWKHTPAASHPGWWASWVEGARYTFGFAPMRTLLILLAVLAWTIAPYSALMPIYAKDVYGGGPNTLGLLLSSAGVGALACMTYLAGRSTVRGLGRVIGRAAFTCALALAAFAYMRLLPVGMALLMLVGGGLILCAASANVILQTIADDRLRGRVASFYTLAFLGVAPLGNLAAGALARWLGAPMTFVLNAVLCTLAGIWYWRALPGLRHDMQQAYERLGISS
ncbi:MAG TPA: MFS transporter [Burkholderiales bacterium]|nr:MFS transporter [Burkholderiales bacterium]